MKTEVQATCLDGVQPVKGGATECKLAGGVITEHVRQPLLGCGHQASAQVDRVTCGGFRV